MHQRGRFLIQSWPSRRAAARQPTDREILPRPLGLDAVQCVVRAPRAAPRGSARFAYEWPCCNLPFSSDWPGQRDQHDQRREHRETQCPDADAVQATERRSGVVSRQRARRSGRPRRRAALIRGEMMNCAIAHATSQTIDAITGRVHAPLVPTKSVSHVISAPTHPARNTAGSTWPTSAPAAVRDGSTANAAGATTAASSNAAPSQRAETTIVITVAASHRPHHLRHVHQRVGATPASPSMWRRPRDARRAPGRGGHESHGGYVPPARPPEITSPRHVTRAPYPPEMGSCAPRDQRSSRGRDPDGSSTPRAARPHARASPAWRPGSHIGKSVRPMEPAKIRSPPSTIWSPTNITCPGACPGTCITSKDVSPTRSVCPSASGASGRGGRRTADRSRAPLTRPPHIPARRAGAAGSGHRDAPQGRDHSDVIHVRVREPDRLEGRARPADDFQQPITFIPRIDEDRLAGCLVDDEIRVLLQRSDVCGVTIIPHTLPFARSRAPRSGGVPAPCQ